jgi:hypothetical protein
MRGGIVNLMSITLTLLEHGDLLAATWKLNSDMTMSCLAFAKAIAYTRVVHV